MGKQQRKRQKRPMDDVVDEILTRLPVKIQTELPMDVVVDETELPMDVVVDEILTRLPVKTLSRFRCVSKQWLSLISGPRFQKKHYLRSQQSPLLLVAKPIPNSTLVRLSIYTSQGVSLLNEFFLRFAGSDINNMVTLELTQSCLGLLCLRTLFDGATLVFNPSTKEMITLPECPDQDCDICIGFGHTASSEEIKVVRFFARPVDDEDCFCEVFTLGTSNGWREAKSPPYRPSPNAHLPLLYGALHFLPCLHYHDHVLDDHYITAFDLHTEHYTKVSLPDIYFGDAKFLMQQAHLAELRGSLCLIFDFYFCKRLLQFWMLKDYHAGKWVKSYNINLSSHSIFSSPFAITADDCILLNTSSREDEKLSYYDTQKNCITKKIETDCCAVFYIDSFTPLGRKDYLSYHQTIA